MPNLEFASVSKSYGSNEVISEFTLEVPDNEFLVLLGPSGCGKSTMLRMIAGLTDISSGDLFFDGNRVNDLSPKKRNISFVFQSYALYPHMTVRQNIAFPLVMDHFRWWFHVPVFGAIARRRLLRRPEISQHVEKIAESLELTELLDRKPAALSGGQRQRVALGRSLIRDPALYLLDEPLSNLDAKLRVQMRAEVTALHARIRKTFVYVTHDQVEAMTMGTRIIVMNKGKVQQYGTPMEIYHQPENVFVATFIGSPPMNVLRGIVTDDGIEIAGRIVGDGATTAALAERGIRDVLVGVRAERCSVGGSEGVEVGQARVESVERLGAQTIVGFSLLGATDSETHFASLPGEALVTLGETVVVRMDLRDYSLFDASTELRISL